MTRKLIVTGATGYLGRAFVTEVVHQGFDVLALTRSKANDLPCKFMMPSDWGNEALLAKAMEGRDALIHMAGLAHGKPGDMTETNVELSETLARAAAAAKLPHVVFVSSAAVFGGSGTFAPEDAPSPTNDYGQSKTLAEYSLCDILADTATKLTIVRPPMVVGPHAPGHAATLRRFFQKNWPLPFGALTNRRSFVTLETLVQALLDLVKTNPARSTLHHISEDPVTATALIRRIADADGLNATLWPVPPFLLKTLGLIPALRRKLLPLTQDHVLTAGQIDLD